MNVVCNIKGDDKIIKTNEWQRKKIENLKLY